MLFCNNCRQAYDLNDRMWDCPNCGNSISSNNGIPLFAPELSYSCKDFPSNSHEDLARQEMQFFWFSYRNILIDWALTSFVEPILKFLDMGCGTGFFLKYLSEKHPLISCSGAEAYLNALQIARLRVPTGSFFQVDAETLPFYEEFDVIGAFDVLEHISDDLLALNEIHRSLRPGGGLIITVPQHPSLWSETDEIACHKRRYTRHRLTNVLKNAGFRIQFISSFMTLLLPAMLCGRIAMSFLGRRKIDRNAEMNISERMNAFFLQICRVEMDIIRRRISLPSGGSLIAVATKEINV